VSPRQIIPSFVEFALTDVGGDEEKVEFLLLFKREQHADEAICPRVFTLWPANPKGSFKRIAGEKLLLQLYCEETGCWHSTGPTGRYTIKLRAAWLETVSPYLRTIVELLRFTIPIAGSAVGLLSPDYESAFKAEIHFTKTLVEKLPKDEKSAQPTSVNQVHQDLFLRKTDGVELRAVEKLLLEVDASRKWGGLSRTITPEGHCLWLCQQHAEKYRR